MKRAVAVTFLLAFLAACGFESDGAKKPTAPARLRGPVSEMLGLSSFLPPGSGAWVEAARANEIALYQAAGLKYLRQNFSWSDIEPSRGNFDYSSYDPLVDAAVAQGREFIGLFHGCVPAWAAPSTGGGTFPPDDPADYAHFAAVTVERYKDKIHYWELWNEQNAERFWKPAPDPEAYGNLLKAVAQAIHAVDPEAKVYFGGLAPIYSAAWGNMWGFLEEAFAFNPDLGDYFDGVAIHTYTFIQIAEPETSDPNNPLKQSVPDMIRDSREVLARWGYPETPIIITEVGWHTASEDPLGSVTEEDQARFLVRNFILSVAAGADIICWYTLRDQWNYLVDSEDAFGLVGYDPDIGDATPSPLKPAFFAHHVLSQVLGDTYYSRDLRSELGLAASQYAYRFQTLDAKKIVLALWTTDPHYSVVLVPPAPGRKTFTQVDMMGNQMALMPSQGYLPVVITQSPIYVVEEK